MLNVLHLCNIFFMFAEKAITMAPKRYVSIRLTEDTMSWVKDLRTAFESCYLHRFSFDEFLEKLRDCVEDAEPGVWEMFCQTQQIKEGLS